MLLYSPEQEQARNAARLAFNQQAVALAANAAIEMIGNSLNVPLDAWRRIDARATQVQRSTLGVFNRLARASQTPVSIADLVNYYPKTSDSGEVQVTMDGRSDAPSDQAIVTYSGTPVPVLTSGARFGWRQMAVMMKGGGMSLDTVTIGNSQRRVAEKLEDMALNGLSTSVVNGTTVYGLRNMPDRNTRSHGLGALASATGAQVLGLFKDMMIDLVNDNHSGTATFFVNTATLLAWSTTEFAANYSKTILQRLLEIPGVSIEGYQSVPANEVLGVANIDTGDWGAILNAMPLTTRPKARHNPEDDYVFGVISAAAPQYRSDYEGRCPLMHAS